jgi:hypothetical protein
MPTLRLLHPIALAALLSLPACGPDLVSTDSDDDGDEPVVYPNEPLPPVDLDAWCDVPETLPPFGDQGPVTRIESLGPCGHLLTWYFDGESTGWTLWYPDGRVEALGTAPRVESDAFSPTGRLLAWAEGDWEGPPLRVTIRDLQTDGSRTIEIQEDAHYGFVRVPDDERGAVLWLCQGDVLELVGVEPEDPRVLAEDVRCETVSGGELSTRLVYAGLDDVLRVVDAKDGTRWSTQVVDAGSGARLSPDGRFAFAYGGDSGMLRRAVDLDRGEVVASCEHLQSEQALASAAPLFVVCDRQLSVWKDEALELVHDEIFSWTISPTRDGSATFRRRGLGENVEIWFAPAEDPSDAQLVISLPDEDLQFLERSRNGQHGRLTVETSACADVDCTETINEVWTWTPAGLGASMFVAGDWRQLHVFEDGQALGFGSPIEGPLPEGVPIPPPQLVLHGPDGVPTTNWPIDGNTSYATPLDDGRLILQTRYGLADYERIFDREAPGVEPFLGPVEFAAMGKYLDPRLGLLALAVEADGYRLYWGRVPD